MLRRWALVVGLLVLTPRIGAAQSASGVSGDYRGTGVILALLPPPSNLHATRPVIIIQHDPIPGLMEEGMAMPFLVASLDLFDGFRPGDRITFDLHSVPDALLVVHIEGRP
jgi:hypothetical protein